MLIYSTDSEYELNAEQLRAASEWLINRIEEANLSSTIESMDIYDDGFHIRTSWEDYCRGCYMGTIEEEYIIPNDIFFSDQSLSKWISEENERRQKKEERKKKREEQARKAAKTHEEKKLLEQLKAKYEMKGD